MIENTNFAVKQDLSLVIPRVFPHWINEKTIIDIFHNQNLGRVYKVSIKYMKHDSRRNGIPIYKAFIYFSVWYDTIIAHNFQQRIFNEGSAKVVYDDPWYWIAMENTKCRLSNNDMRIMRVSYQNYLSEQTIERLSIRINKMEEELEGWSKVTVEESMNTIGEELSLTETAMNCAERVLSDDE